MCNLSASELEFGTVSKTRWGTGILSAAHEVFVLRRKMTRTSTNVSDELFSACAGRQISGLHSAPIAQLSKYTQRRIECSKAVEPTTEMSHMPWK